MVESNSIVTRISDWFWTDSFWLPEGVSFKDMEDVPGFSFPKISDLYLMPICALGFILIRFLYENLLGKYIARKWFGIKNKQSSFKRSPYLEKIYTKNKTPTAQEMKEFSTEMRWQEVQVVNWFIRRRNADRPDLSKKFCEASWRFIFYLFAFSIGISILVQAPWFYDTYLCWIDYPYQTMWRSVYFYYLFEGGFYMSLVCTLMYDVKRKDFTEQIIHHAATIILIVFSYAANFVRAGCIVMAIHDISDVFLEIAKCFVYAKYEVLADNLFTIFAVVFIISRLIVFPYMVLYTTMVKSMWLYPPYAGYYFLNGMLLVLQCLHIFWAAIIVRMAVRMARVGKLEKDARSDVEEDSLDESDQNGVMKQNGNSKKAE